MDGGGLVGRWRRRLGGASSADGPAGSSEPLTDDERLLLESPLFDEQWYSARAGAPDDRLAAVRHYLSTGSAAGLPPHPLVDPWYIRRQLGPQRRGRLGDGDPLCFYLRRRLWEFATHPLFDAERYLVDHPEAGEHPAGPTAHYCEVGADRGDRPNDWLPAGTDLRGWIAVRHGEWEARRQGPEATPHPARAGTARTTVIVVGAADPVAVTESVQSVASHGGIQVLVHDDAAPAHRAVVLDALPERFPDVVVRHSHRRLGRAEAINLALASAAGQVVVLVDAGVVLTPEALTALAGALADPDVLGAEPVVLAQDGTVESAGVAFPTGGGLPYPLLAGFPVEDTAGLSGQAVPALSGAALAVRYADLHDTDALDPTLGRLALVDLCLRLAAQRPGRFAVLLDHPARRTGPATPARPDDLPADAAAAFRERWRGADLPGGAAAPEERLWAACGFQVRAPRPADPWDRVLPARTGRIRPASTAPRPLRWAIKNAALAGPVGETWGDTHFARALADALRELGHEVVIDAREAWDRPTSAHDDVALLLRGRAPWAPAADGAVALAWIISHPDQVTAEEARRYDRVFAASVPWSRRTAAAWGVEVEPLLQATDPRRFHPDRAEPDSGHRVLFVGNSRGEHRAIVRDAVEAGVPLSIYGAGWERFLPPGLVAAERIDNDDLGAAYRSCGIVLNDHWDDMRREGFLSNRLFDAAACAARVVTDAVAGLADDYAGLFGESVQVYRTPADLARLGRLLQDPGEADAVFGGDAARREVAARIAREHSFSTRAARLVEAAHRARARRGLVD